MAATISKSGANTKVVQDGATSYYPLNSLRITPDDKSIIIYSLANGRLLHRLAWDDINPKYSTKNPADLCEYYAVNNFFSTPDTTSSSTVSMQSTSTSSNATEATLKKILAVQESMQTAIGQMQQTLNGEATEVTLLKLLSTQQAMRDSMGELKVVTQNDVSKPVLLDILTIAANLLTALQSVSQNTQGKATETTLNGLLAALQKQQTTLETQLQVLQNQQNKLTAVSEQIAQQATRQQAQTVEVLNSMLTVAMQPVEAQVVTVTLPATSLHALVCPMVKAPGKHVTIQLLSIGLGATIRFECSNDTVNWVDFPMQPITETTLKLKATTSTTGVYHATLPALYFRARVSALGLGSLSAITVFHVLPISLP